MSYCNDQSINYSEQMVSKFSNNLIDNNHENNSQQLLNIVCL